MLLRRSVLSKANWLSKWSSRSSALRSYSGTALRSSSAKPKPSYNLLNEQHYDFIDAERELLSDLHRVLQKVDSDSSQENLDLVHDLKSRIDDLFMVVVVGEFNAGKSTFINSLLGDKYLKSGVLPTTDRICLLRSNKENSDIAKDLTTAKEAGSADGVSWRRSDHLLLEDVEELAVKSADWLQPGVALVDTPGTNALMSRHEHLSKVIVPRADLILFVTSAERPMSESECSFLSRIASWGKKVVICLNKKDILGSDKEIKEVEDYVRLSAASRLQYTNGKVPVFALSSKQALDAKLAAKSHNNGNNGGVDDSDAASSSTQQQQQALRMYEASGIKQLETFLASTLGREEVVLNKLGTPLTVADRLVAQTLEELRRREERFLKDVRTLEMIEENMESFETDLRRDVLYLREKVGAVFAQSQTRMASFVVGKVTLGNARGFLGDNAAASEREFQRALHKAAQSDLAQPVMEAVRDVAELMAQRSRNQASSVVQYVDSSSMTGKEQEERRRVGRVTEIGSGQWEAARMELVARLERESKLIVGGDGAVTADDAAWAFREAKGAVGVSAVIAATGAVGFLSALAVPELIPGGVIPGVSVGVASALLVLSGPLFARKKSTIQQRVGAKLSDAGGALDRVIEEAFEHELRNTSELIRSSIAPYERYVTHEAALNRQLQAELGDVRDRARALEKALKGARDV
jgi:tRNA U34 5-carboxymethylaminomethyl modifying GTPase MnmE/TrmE